MKFTCLRLIALLFFLSVFSSPTNASCKNTLLDCINQDASDWLTDRVPEDFYHKGIKQLDVHPVLLNRYTYAVRELEKFDHYKLESNIARSYIGSAYDEGKAGTYYLVRGVMSDIPGNISALWFSHNNSLLIDYTFLGKNSVRIYFPVIVSLTSKPLSVSVITSGGNR